MLISIDDAFTDLCEESYWNNVSNDNVCVVTTHDDNHTIHDHNNWDQATNEIDDHLIIALSPAIDKTYWLIMDDINHSNDAVTAQHKDTDKKWTHLHVAFFKQRIGIGYLLSLISALHYFQT